ncbi:MAG: Crp/Fnr family transcriptional regulator, partial [Moraxellaceae bacterium]
MTTVSIYATNILKQMISLLQRLYQFPGLQGNDLKQVIGSHELQTFKKGENIASAGSIARQYHIVSTGMVRSYVMDPNGNEITTGFYKPGDIVIEVASFFRQQPSLENFQALTGVTLHKLGFDEFQQMFRDMPALAEWGRMWMTQALSLQKQRMLDMIIKTAQERYVELLETHRTWPHAHCFPNQWLRPWVQKARR